MDRTAGVALAGHRPVRLPKRLLALRPDAKLADHVRAGDDAAFEVLYERHVAGVLGFCRHMLGSQQEAEDAVQHVFVAAHDALTRGSADLAVKPWLYTVARNRCLSMLRARREQATDPPEPSTAGLADEVDRRADLRELVADLERLPEQQRAALVLTELGDLSHAEVADVLNVHHNAIKGIVFRARSALIERREARAAPCADVREQLATATGGTFRRSGLRYHLEECPDCRAYREQVRHQRKALAVALPVVPTLALHDTVMASVGIGGATAGAAAAGGAAAASSAGGAASAGAGAGGAAVGGALAKVAIVGVLAGGAGLAGEAVVDRSDPDRPDGAPAAVGEPAGASSGAAGTGAGASRAGGARGEDGSARGRSGERSHGRRGRERRERGWRRSHERSRGHSRAGAPPGRSANPPGVRHGQQGTQPSRGQAAPAPAPRGGSAPSSPPVQGSPQPAAPAPAPAPPSADGVEPPPQPAPPGGARGQGAGGPPLE